MALTIPNAVNYPSPLNALPFASALRDPPEGPKLIPVEILWGTMGGANKAVAFNLFGNSPQTLSRIAAYAVDNSGCGADVDIIFADTLQTVTIPAFAPFVVFNVYTNVTAFYVVAPNASAADVTRFNILNTPQPPIAIPDTQEQATVVGNNIPWDAAGTDPLIAAGINGILTNIQITAAGPVTVAGASSLYLSDGLGVNKAAGVMGGAIGWPGGTVLDLTGVQIDFTNGLNITQFGSSPGASCFLAYNISYRRTN